MRWKRPFQQKPRPEKRLRPQQEIFFFVESNIFSYRHGFDLTGRPIMYFRDRRQNTKDYPNQVNQVISTLEQAIETMDLDNGVESWLLIFDFKGYSMSNAPPMSTSREVSGCDCSSAHARLFRFSTVRRQGCAVSLRSRRLCAPAVFMNQYPERLGRAIMIDAPWLFSAFYRAISVFLPSNTKAKVQFVSGSLEAKREALSAHVAPDVLEVHLGSDVLFTCCAPQQVFGGDNDCKYVHRLYWAEESKQHALFVVRAHRICSCQRDSLAQANEQRLLKGESAETPKRKTKRKKVKK